MMNLKYPWIVVFAGLAMAGLACSAFGRPVSPTPTLPRPTQLTATAEPATSTAVASHTPVSPTAVPCPAEARFVTDITVPDDTLVEPGAQFVKTWRMENSGRCAWESGTTWRFLDGSQMGGVNAIPVNPALPGETVDLSVSLMAPNDPGTYTGNWQLFTPLGTPIGRPAYIRIRVSGTPTPGSSPTPSPTATATSTAVPGAPIINYFRANVQIADPGDTIWLEWEIIDAESATIYHIERGGPMGEPHWEIANSGTVSTTISTLERESTTFILFADNTTGGQSESVTIKLNCPDIWFFTPAPEGCPASPALFSDGAEQPFEHGTMIWVKESNGIFVLFDDNSSPEWNFYADDWSEGDPIDDPSIVPPPGYYQPVRGFGLLWREESTMRDRLGWAEAPEIAFSTAVQRNSPPKYPSTYIRALDGQIWLLHPERSGWEKIP